MRAADSRAGARDDPDDQRGGEPDGPGEGRDDDGPVTCGAGTAGAAVPAPTPFGSVIRIRRLRHGFRSCYLAAATEDRWSGGGTGSSTEPGRRRPGALPGIRRAGPVLRLFRVGAAAVR